MTSGGSWSPMLFPACSAQCGLAAAMRVHGVTHLLTLNSSDFARYPGIAAVHPATLAYSS